MCRTDRSAFDELGGEDERSVSVDAVDQFDERGSEEPGEMFESLGSIVSRMLMRGFTDEG